MTVEIKINILRKIAESMKQKMAAVTMRTAVFMQNDIRGQMSDVKSGVMYGSHRASAPGEAPAPDTTDLIESISAAQVDEVNAATFTSVPYSVPLEFGNASGTLEKRPSFIPAAERGAEFLKEELRKEFG